MLKEISNETYIKTFAGQVTAVDVLYSIHSAEQLILGIKALQVIEYIWTENFISDIFELDPYLPELTSTWALFSLIPQLV